MAAHVELRASTPNQDPVVDANGLKVKLVDPDRDDYVTWDSNYVRLLDSGPVKVGAGVIDRFAVGAAGTTITINIYDSLAGSGTVIFGPYVLVAGASIELGGLFGTGCYISFSGTTGTPNLTAFFR